MAVHTDLWKVGSQPQPLMQSILSSERFLEDMIVADPRLLSSEWMIIGRQESTGFSGRIDLLAIAPDGALVLIEIKRDRTPRDVVAQALDYACWVQTLQSEDVAAIYRRFAPGKDLLADFHDRFGQELDEEALNQSHQIVIVASSLDAGTERIINYLNARDISINVLCFQVFAHGSEQLISRSWLLDPVTTQVITASAQNGPNEPWNGEFYHSFGASSTRSWDDAVEFGFICGGGAPWYSRTLRQLNPGDRVWAYVPATGYVGVGRVKGHAQSSMEFVIETVEGTKPVLEVAKRGTYHAESYGDPEHCEYFVPVQWLQTVSLNQAVQEIGFFSNQNTICKPTSPKWRSTIERLKDKFKNFDNE